MLVIGLDEAGRGAWAGPLVAAAVYLDRPIPGLADSKLLTAKKRQELFKLITKHAQFGIGQVTNSDIDNHGLSWAQTQAMSQALRNLGVEADAVIVDGSIDYLKLPNSKAVIDADALYPAVMAAGIVAKVTRDRLMQKLEQAWPGYGFSAHKGYGTRAHRQALVVLGVCPQHRLSYKPVAAAL